MEIGTLLWDNPILVKHVRSRLRRRHLFPSIIAVMIVASCMLWGALAAGHVKDGGAFLGLLARWPVAPQLQETRSAPKRLRPC